MNKRDTAPILLPMAAAMSCVVLTAMLFPFCSRVARSPGYFVCRSVLILDILLPDGVDPSAFQRLGAKS